MNKPTNLAGAWALLAALPSPALACGSGTLGQAANAHGLNAPYSAGAAVDSCPAAPASAAAAREARQPTLAGAGAERRGRGRTASLALRGRRNR